MNVQEVSLDISLRRGISPEVYLGQDDSNATTLVASVFDGAAPFDLTGYTVRFCMRLPDGVHYYSVVGEVDGNVATFDIDETYAGAVHGTTDVAYVEISDGNDVIASTSRMCVIVLRGAQAGATPGEAYISEIEEAVERLDEAVEEAEEVLEHGIPLMSASTRGGAMLGTGLAMNGEVLSTDPSTVVMKSEKGAANGVAELDQNGLVLSSQLPSYVDDVLEYASTSQFPATGESGKIYVAVNTNLTYRWTGSAYTEISPSLALGETSSTAYRGDRGAAAYAHAVTNKGSAFSSNLYKITTNSEGHVTAATPATSADIVAFLNNQAITPSSVTASGTIKGGTISDGVGTLAQLRDSVSRVYVSTDGRTVQFQGTDIAFRFGVASSNDYMYVNVRIGDTWLGQKIIANWS